MRRIKFILLILVSFSNIAYSQLKDTLYIKLSNDVIEKILVEKVDSFSVNDNRDSLYIYQKQQIFGDEVQIINRKSLAMVDSIYFYHSMAADAEVALFQSYILNGKAEAMAFNPGMDSVMNLTITGTDISRTDLNSLSFYVDKVKGVFTLDGTGVSGWPLTFFAGVQFDSSLVIKNNLFFDNINAFQFAITGIINGDLILENNPWMDFGWGNEMSGAERTAGFMKVAGVEGDLILKNLRNFGSNFSGLEGVKYVGGDIIIDNCANGSTIRSLENFALMTIDSIAGDLLITNNAALSSLKGLENIAYIGGNVTITNNGANGTGIPLSGTTAEGFPGFCWIKDALDAGVIQEGAIITLTDKAGITVDLNTLTGCN
jgi:hypothetical protein